MSESVGFFHILSELLDHSPQEGLDTAHCDRIRIQAASQKARLLDIFGQGLALCYFPTFISTCLFQLVFVVYLSLHLLYMFF